jgi:hypothetical protein
VDELEEAVSGKKAAVKPNGQPRPGPIGNTQGIIVPDTAPNPYGNSAPDIALETPEEKSFLDKVLEMGDIKVLQDASQGIQDKIDGMVEASGYSVPAMVIGSISKAVVEVFMPTNVIDLVPGGKVGRLAKKGADALKKGKKGKKAKNADGDGGGKNMGGGKKTKVKCFCPSDHAQGGRDEYKRQLEKQQKGINGMSADDYLRERQAYTGKNPCSKYSPATGGKTKIRDRDVTKKARKDRLDQLNDQYYDEMRSKGMSRADAKRLGEAKAKREVGNQDPLHNQDMVAGGDDVIGSGGKLTGADFGESKVNRHIGSQWNGDRIKGIDAEACQMQKEGRGQDKMNVELRVCGKHEAKKAGCKPPKGKK